MTQRIHHILLTAAAFLLPAMTINVPAGAQTSVASNVIRARQKPDKPWKEYPTTTLRDLKGFRTGADAHVDEYGGNADIARKATGYFIVSKEDGRWWLIDPAGHPYYNKAVVSVTFGKSKTSEKEVSGVFGSPERWADSTVVLLKGWGFNGTGAWTDEKVTKSAHPRIPYTIIWNFMSGYGKRRGGTYQQAGHTGYPEDCIFVFDAEFETYCEERAGNLEDLSNDPYLIGHFTDNELPFPSDALDRFVRLDKREEGYKAAVKWLRSRHGDTATAAAITDTDRADFLGVVADKYFSVTSSAIRKADPHHLIIGTRFHGKTLKQQPVFAAAGKYIDIISINYYETWTPDTTRMGEWVNWSGRPILITEWYVKGDDAGLPNNSGAGWIVPTQADRGLFYQHFALNLLRFKGCVGWQWFKYIDNDPAAADVDPSNSDSNKGIVSIHFEPYLPLTERMRELNERVYGLINYFDGAESR